MDSFSSKITLAILRPLHSYLAEHPCASISTSENKSVQEDVRSTGIRWSQSLANAIASLWVSLADHLTEEPVGNWKPKSWSAATFCSDCTPVSVRAVSYSSFLLNKAVQPSVLGTKPTLPCRKKQGEQRDISNLRRSTSAFGEFCIHPEWHELSSSLLQNLYKEFIPFYALGLSIPTLLALTLTR